MTPFSVSLLYDIDCKLIIFSGEVDDVPAPISEIYVKVFLPEATDAAKTSWKVGRGQPETTLELFVAGTDPPHAEVLVTIGSTQVPVRVEVNGPTGVVGLEGVSGQSLLLAGF